MIVAQLLLELFKNKLRPVSKNHPVVVDIDFNNGKKTTKNLSMLDFFHWQTNHSVRQGNGEDTERFSGVCTGAPGLVR